MEIGQHFTGYVDKITLRYHKCIVFHIKPMDGLVQEI